MNEVAVNQRERRQRLAPIDYHEMRAVYQTLRLVMAAMLVGLGIIGVMSDGGYPITVGAGTLVVIDALFRLTRGTTPLPSLLLDTIAFGSVLLLRGEAPYSGSAGAAFIIVATVLMLPGLHAALVTGIAALFGAAVVLWSPLLSSEPSITDTPLLDQVGMLVFLIGMAIMLFTASRSLRSMRKKHAEALEAERKAALLKDEFVSMVSHELRTPLTSISGFTETLRESWPMLGEREIDEFLSIMSRETTHLGNLVEDILVIPRLEAGRLRLEPEDVDLHEAAYSVVEVTITPDAHKEAFVAIPGGVFGYVDPVRIRQVLRNLIENARKYGGDQILVEGSPEGDLYQVVVSDNGPGVAEQDRDRIFEHFEQVSKGDARTDSGVGLGLPIARRLVSAMGGELWYEQRFPVGSRFCFTVPLSRGQSAAANRQTDRDAGARAPLGNAGARTPLGDAATT